MMLVIGVDRKRPADSQDGAFDPGDIDPIRPCTISFAVMEARRDGYGVDLRSKLSAQVHQPYKSERRVPPGNKFAIPIGKRLN